MPKYEPMPFDEDAVLENEKVQSMLHFHDTFTLVSGDIRIRVEKGRVKTVGRKIKAPKRKRK